MKPRRVILLALISGLITTGLFYMYMNKSTPAGAGPEAAAEMVTVVVAGVDIKKDQQIIEENLILKELPKDQVHDTALHKTADAIGKFATADIKAGEVIMSHRIRAQNEVTDVISRKISEGKRGVSIQVEYDQSVSNLIVPEDYVDVMLTVVLDPEIPLIETDLILEKVRVLAVGERMIEKSEGDVEKTYMTVTLELTQEQSVELVHASERGNIHLALYSKVDSIKEETEKEQKQDEPKKPEKKAKVGSDKDTRFVTIPERSIIRKAPQLTAPVVTVVDQGTALLFLDDQSTDEDKRVWFKVRTADKKNGWISSRIVKHENE